MKLDFANMELLFGQRILIVSSSWDGLSRNIQSPGFVFYKVWYHGND